MYTPVEDGDALPSPRVPHRIITLELELRTMSLNQSFRMHPKDRGRRVKAQKEAIGYALRGLGVPALPLLVRFVRISARELDDDNLAGAFKAARDAVATWLGVNDRDRRVTWRYAQEVKQTAKIRIFDREGVMHEVHRQFVRIELEQP